MTVSSENNREDHDGNGVTTIFATPAFINDGDIQVTLRDTANVENPWTLGTQYTLSGAGQEGGGQLTVITSPTDYTPQTGEKLTIISDPPRTQPAAFPEGGPFPSKTVETSYDRLTIMVQQLADILARALTVPVTDNTLGSFVLPIDTVRANQFLLFDPTGRPTVSPGTDGNLSASQWVADNFLNAADQAAARAALAAAGLSVPNSFTALQTLLANMLLQWNNDGADFGPNIDLYRNSQAPADNDGEGRIRWLFNNAAATPEQVVGAALQIVALTVAEGNEAALMRFVTRHAGATGTRGEIRQGWLVGAPVGLDKGQGTLNAENGLYDAGNRLGSVILGSGSVSNAASLDITDLPAGFRYFELAFDDLVPATATADLLYTSRAVGGGPFDTGAADYRAAIAGSQSGSTAFQTNHSAGAANIQLGLAAGQGIIPGACGVLRLFNPRDASQYTRFTVDWAYRDNSGQDVRIFAEGSRQIAQDVDAFRLAYSTGNIDSMNWTLYGYR